MKTQSWMQDPKPSPPASDSLAIACGGLARIWRPLGSEASEPLVLQHSGTCTSLRYNHNNKVLASATDEGRFRLHYHTGSLMGGLPAEGTAMGPVSSIAFSRGSKLLAAGCRDSQLHLWDLKLQVTSLASAAGVQAAGPSLWLICVAAQCCQECLGLCLKPAPCRQMISADKITSSSYWHAPLATVPEQFSPSLLEVDPLQARRYTITDHSAAIAGIAVQPHDHHLASARWARVCSSKHPLLCPG